MKRLLLAVALLATYSVQAVEPTIEYTCGNYSVFVQWLANSNRNITVLKGDDLQAKGVDDVTQAVGLPPIVSLQNTDVENNGVIYTLVEQVTSDKSELGFSNHAGFIIGYRDSAIETKAGKTIDCAEAK